jgi:hypothetical protein
MKESLLLNGTKNGELTELESYYFFYRYNSRNKLWTNSQKTLVLFYALFLATGLSNPLSVLPHFTISK